MAHKRFIRVKVLKRLLQISYGSILIQLHNPRLSVSKALSVPSFPANDLETRVNHPSSEISINDNRRGCLVVTIMATYAIVLPLKFMYMPSFINFVQSAHLLIIYPTVRLVRHTPLEFNAGVLGTFLDRKTPYNNTFRTTNNGM
jgi:hypothetical protein